MRGVRRYVKDLLLQHRRPRPFETAAADPVFAPPRRA
jgi:hypothetical protein